LDTELSLSDWLLFRLCAAAEHICSAVERGQGDVNRKVVAELIVLLKYPAPFSRNWLTPGSEIGKNHKKGLYPLYGRILCSGAPDSLSVLIHGIKTNGRWRGFWMEYSVQMVTEKPSLMTPRRIWTGCPYLG
jgi:hypothetical protein